MSAFIVVIGFRNAFHCHRGDFGKYGTAVLAWLGSDTSFFFAKRFISPATGGLREKPQKMIRYFSAACVIL